jgi:hypothetical protein
MKSWLLTSLFVTASFSLQAGVVKSCKTVMELDNSKVPTEITITQKGESLKSIMKQTVDGQVSELQDTVTVGEYVIEKVISDLDSDDIDSLNKGEKYISHALSVVGEIPGQNAGLSLKEVKFVKVYELNGEDGDMFRLAIIEAYNKYRKNLGSFVGGFLVSPCK